MDVELHHWRLKEDAVVKRILDEPLHSVNTIGTFAQVVIEMDLARKAVPANYLLKPANVPADNYRNVAFIGRKSLVIEEDIVHDSLFDGFLFQQLHFVVDDLEQIVPDTRHVEFMRSFVAVQSLVNFLNVAQE